MNRESINTSEVLDMTEGGTQEWRNIASMNTRRMETFRVRTATGSPWRKIGSVIGGDVKSPYQTLMFHCTYMLDLSAGMGCLM